jgi:hypothetical protein
MKGKIMKLVETIKTMLSDAQLDLEPKRDQQLDDYIIAKAKKELKGKNGAIDDQTVLSWARHFYLESQEDIDKEIKELRGKSYIKQSVNKPVTRKETKPDKKELKIYNDKGKVVKAIQESLFS